MLENEQSPIPEEAKSSKFLNLTDLNHQQMGQLQERVQQSNGWIEVWIHTHYEEEDLNASFSGYGSKEKNEEYINARKRIIQSLQNKQRMPVVVFIPVDRKSKKIEQEWEKVYNIDQTAAPVYFVTTESDDPSPAYGFVLSSEYDELSKLQEKEASEVTEKDSKLIYWLFYGEAPPDDWEPKPVSARDWPQFKGVVLERLKEKLIQSQDDEWEKLTNLLKELKVKGMILRGRNYFIGLQAFGRPEAIDRAYQNLGLAGELPGGCLGDACKRFLLADFNVRISGITYPNKPSKELTSALRNKK